MSQSSFDASLATLGLVLVAAFVLVVGFHLPWIVLALPLGILVIGIVYTLLADLRRRR